MTLKSILLTRPPHMHSDAGPRTSLVGSRSRRCNKCLRRAQRDHVTVGTEPDYPPHRYVRDSRVMAKRLALIDVRQMHFDTLYANREDHVANRHARMRICGGIDNQRINAPARRLYPINDRAFAIRLKGLDCQPHFAPERLDLVVDLVERGATVNHGFALAE